ncbi:MAG: mechanosensitive ion channel family protein [Candidatus Omnitrophica bacterium]|nr:mechanosensitive ion channel family protein [Candidatus Omnitrophota bacterium]
MWQRLQEYVLSMNEQVIPKVLTTLLIFIAAVIITRILRVFLSRWYTQLIGELEKKRSADISSIETKFLITRRILSVGIYFFAFILFLLQFEAMRNIGTGLLASAGIAGVVIGMAAQNSLSNIIAGISISFAQPVRLNDAVIFEDDFGWIEEISLMNTIIRTWDNRRIIVPNDVLSKKVIQNWTIKDPSLLGVVMLYVDYTCDVDMIRKWVKEIVHESAFSTAEKVAAVQVVDFTEKSMVIRILGKGANAPVTWDLRCEIREKLIKKFKEAGLPLPRLRVDSGGYTPAGIFDKKKEAA